MHNKYSLQVAYLAHMTPEEKHEYNIRYYQKNKDKWRIYNDVQNPRITTWDNVQRQEWAPQKKSGPTYYQTVGSATDSSEKAYTLARKLSTNEVKSRSVPSTYEQFHQKWDAKLTDYANSVARRAALNNPSAALKAGAATIGDKLLPNKYKTIDDKMTVSSLRTDYNIEKAKVVVRDIFSKSALKTSAEFLTDAGRVAVNKGKQIFNSLFGRK